MAIIFAILLFSILIFLHELGHFLAAKASGVRVNEFAIFMGPAIFKKKVGETTYSLRCIPIGGYCAMEGEDDDSDDPRSFSAAAWWKRLIILVAGSFMNLVTGILIITIVLFAQPRYATTQVVDVQPWSYCGGENGLMPGDTIVEFDGSAIRIQEDFALATMLKPAGNYDIVVIRNGERILLDDVRMEKQLTEDENGNQQMLYGLFFGVEETTAASVPGRIIPTAVNEVRSVVMQLKMLITGQASFKDVGGPIQIVKIMSDSVAASETTSTALLNMLSLGAFIAINLAVMNMLPIPALDGGRVLTLLITIGYEKITKKKLNPKYERYIHGVGMFLLLALMAVIFLKDIITIF